MKTIFRFQTLFSLLACLCLAIACSDDSLPYTTGQDTETPAEAPDALHDKLREKPYPKADNEIYINPAPFIVPQAMKTGDKLQFSLSNQADFSGTETILSTPKSWCMYNIHKTLKFGTGVSAPSFLTAANSPGVKHTLLKSKTKLPSS